MTTLVEATGIKFYLSNPEGTEAAPFTDIAGGAIDPDVVTFTYWIERVLQNTYTYTNGASPPDPNYVIVRDGVGLYHAYISTVNLAGMWAWAWTGAPGVSGLDTSKTYASCKGGPIEVCRLGP
jgi:hypothetical protein